MVILPPTDPERRRGQLDRLIGDLDRPALAGFEVEGVVGVARRWVGDGKAACIPNWLTKRPWSSA
jgi:hypothetical protein